MEKIYLEQIEFVNKGDADFETKKQPLNANNLNKIQKNINDTLILLQEEINKELEKLTAFILWENNDLQATFDAQKITLNTDNFSSCEILYIHGGGTNFCYSQKLLKGYGTRLFVPTLDGITYREVSYVSDTELNVATANKNGTSVNNLAIPVCIIGYK